jgi:glycine oxidase
MRVERLTGRDCRRLEPMLAPGVRGGVLLGDDHSIDPRRFVGALLAAATHVGVDVRRDHASRLLVDNDGHEARAAGVALGDGSEIRAGTVVLAAGCWSGGLAGVPENARPPVRPVKGQILRMRSSYPFVTRTVRGVVRGSTVYVVPRSDGEIVVGATSEELGFDTTVSAGGVYELLRDAHELLPGTTELELTETTAALRPGSPDNMPILGESALPGLVLATGHYRSGVLLTPVTADLIAELLETGTLPNIGTPFSPLRFHSEEVSA